ncbi:hypothetical protein Q3G72_027629 [Acer saccharum]|nr:hypothetical protein Q3G72_027629 [Acer saccharum]
MAVFSRDFCEDLRRVWRWWSFIVIDMNWLGNLFSFHDHAVPGRTTSDGRRRDDRVGREVRGGDRVVAASEKELRKARV